jgi:hypothetical protein
LTLDTQAALAEIILIADGIAEISQITGMKSPTVIS